MGARSLTSIMVARPPRLRPAAAKMATSSEGDMPDEGLGVEGGGVGVGVCAGALDAADSAASASPIAAGIGP